jgi:hypothetical protein
MTEQRNEESGAAAAAESAPDWVTHGPKPIELPPLDEAEEQKRRRSERSGSGGWLVLILVLMAALIGTSPYWAPPFAALLPWSPRADTDALAADNSRQAQRLDTLAQQQSQLEQRLARLEDQARGAAALAQQQQQQAASLEQLAQRIAALEQRPSTGGDPAQIAALQDELKKLAAAAAQNGERLAKLETRDGTAGNEARSDQALLLALGQLRERLQSGRPFDAELAAVETIGRDRPEVRQTLQPLEAAAAKGIPTMTVLTHRFEQNVVPAALRAAQAPQSDDWGDRILARLRSLVVVRRIDDSGVAARDPADAAVTRAEAALGSGDLADAVAAVETLPGRAAAAAQPWLAEARQRLAAEQALAKLTEGVTARFAAGDGRSADR